MTDHNKTRTDNIKAELSDTQAKLQVFCDMTDSYELQMANNKPLMAIKWLEEAMSK